MAKKLRHWPFWGLGKRKRTGKCYQHIFGYVFGKENVSTHNLI